MDINGSVDSSISSNYSIHDNDHENLPSSSSNTNHDSAIPCGIIQTLLSHRKISYRNPDFDIFSKRAIESLVKKLKERKDDLEHLAVAISTNGAQETPCICISRTLDGRLQVAGKKGFPHVIFSRIWRWPELNKNELRHLQICRYPFDFKLDNVCINPYHYERISPPSNIFPMLSQVNPFSSQLAVNNPNCGSNSCSLSMSNKNENSHALNGSARPPNIPINLLNIPQDLKQKTQMLSGPGSTSQHEDGKAGNGDHNPFLSLNSPSNFSSIDKIPVPHNSSSETNYSLSYTQVPYPSVAPYNSGNSCTNTQQTNKSEELPYNFTDFSKNNICDHWCMITYHEFEITVGEPFKVPIGAQSVTIDGYFDLNNISGSRMSLGQFTNIHRTDASERTRMYVGKGIELKRENDNDIYLFCHSDCSVFVESYYLDDLVNKSHGTVVHKIYPRACLKFFDFNSCIRSMISHIQQFSITYERLPNVDEETNYRNMHRAMINSLLKFCGVRVSFVKGWGPDYPRHHIHNTPCWVDVLFTKPVMAMNELIDSYHINANCSVNSSLSQFPQRI